MEVASGDEDLESLLQNFHRVSQVLDTSRTAPPTAQLPVLLTLRPPGRESRSGALSPPATRFGLVSNDRAPRCTGLLGSSAVRFTC
jgi:hypothetical protein